MATLRALGGRPPRCSSVWNAFTSTEVPHAVRSGVRAPLRSATVRTWCPSAARTWATASSSWLARRSDSSKLPVAPWCRHGQGGTGPTGPPGGPPAVVRRPGAPLSPAWQRGATCLRRSPHWVSTGTESGRSRSMTSKEAKAPLWRSPALTRRKNDSSGLSSIEVPFATDAERT